MIVPVYNEQEVLEQNITKLYNYAKRYLVSNFSIVISDSLSTDETESISKSLVDRYAEVKYIRLNKRGKGLAIRETQKHFQADWFCFIDADLPVPLHYLKILENIILTDRFDLIIGNRHGRKSNLVASPLRKFVSICYLNLAKLILFDFRIQDLQAGFKAWNNNIKNNIFPLVTNEKWFFDTELVYHSFNKNMKIKYFPITYYLEVEGERQSKVNLFKSSFQFFINLIRLRFS